MHMKDVTYMFCDSQVESDNLGCFTLGLTI